jgi:hypothetical protein
MKKNPAETRLFLGDQPRLEIPLAPGTPGPLPTWLTVGLPGPLAEPRPEGLLRADPRLPECAITFAWSQVPAVPRALTVLTLAVGGESWVLEQDIRNPQRWLLQADPDHRRHWS